MANKFVITKEIQDTVKSQPSITKVYFDDNGNHYFNVHKLPKGEKDKTDPKDYELYGKGKVSHRQIIPGIFNVDKITEVISKGEQSTKIVKIYTRDEVLNFNVKPSGDSLVAKVANMSDSEREALRAMLGAPSVTAPSTKDEDEEKVI